EGSGGRSGFRPVVVGLDDGHVLVAQGPQPREAEPAGASGAVVHDALRIVRSISRRPDFNAAISLIRRRSSTSSRSGPCGDRHTGGVSGGCGPYSQSQPAVPWGSQAACASLSWWARSTPGSGPRRVWAAVTTTPRRARRRAASRRRPGG